MDHVSYGTRDEVQLAAYKYGTTSSLQSTQGAFPTAHHIVRTACGERASTSIGRLARRLASRQTRCTCRSFASNAVE